MAVALATAPCWVQRMEIDPRYDYTGDAWDPEPCDHAACAADDCDFHDWGCPVAECRWNAAHAMCDLDKDHEGDHQFVNSDEIILTFSEIPADPPGSEASASGSPAGVLAAPVARTTGERPEPGGHPRETGS